MESLQEEHQLDHESTECGPQGLATVRPMGR